MLTVLLLYTNYTILYYILTTLYYTVHNASQPLIHHMNAFITILATLSTDSNTTIRSAVCQSITIISTTHVAVLAPYFTNICIFMLQSLLDNEESVAIESCEFWVVMLETSDTKKAILPYLPVLIQHVISRLLLSTEQMEQERQDEEEENTGEKTLNLRPMHHRNSTAHGSSGSSSNDDDVKEGAELSSKWTLRKQAALLLDTIAVSFAPTDVLNAALPKMQECFQHSEVLVRECGMLALGALSSGMYCVTIVYGSSTMMLYYYYKLQCIILYTILNTILYIILYIILYTILYTIL